LEDSRDLLAGEDTDSPELNPAASRLLLWLLRTGRFRKLNRILQTLLGTDFHSQHFGKDLRLPHPFGVVVHSATRIGEGCVIYHGVTIGAHETRGAGATIGDNVAIFAGAKIIGPVNIGDGARIGANAVVIADVPEGAVAVGVPARIIRQDRPGP
jgi:serine O-acetyltransferase